MTSEQRRNLFFRGLLIGLALSPLCWLLVFGMVEAGRYAYTWWRDEATDGQFLALPFILSLAIVSVIIATRKDNHNG